MVDIKFIHGDCLEEMPKLADKSIDMILCDLPYGTTACKWDTIIPFEPLWKQYKRLIKDNAAIVLTASQPFTSALVMSNIKMFKYEWIWRKSKGTNFQLAFKNPLKVHENIVVFYNKLPIYNQVNGIECNEKTFRNIENVKMAHLQKKDTNHHRTLKNLNKSVLDFGSVHNPEYHPTQKPVALFEYLIRTYTNEGDTVLDNCSGSGTTGIAAFNTKRNAILIEKDEQYFNAAKERFDRETRQVAMW